MVNFLIIVSYCTRHIPVQHYWEKYYAKRENGSKQYQVVMFPSRYKRENKREGGVGGGGIWGINLVLKVVYISYTTRNWKNGSKQCQVVMLPPKQIKGGNKREMGGGGEGLEGGGSGVSSSEGSLHSIYYAKQENGSNQYQVVILPPKGGNKREMVGWGWGGGSGVFSSEGSLHFILSVETGFSYYASTALLFLLLGVYDLDLDDGWVPLVHCDFDSLSYLAGRR